MKKITFLTLCTFAISVFSFAQEDKENVKKYSDTFLTPLPVLKSHRFLLNTHIGSTYGLAYTYKLFPDDIRFISIVKNGTAAAETFTANQTPWKGLGDGFRFGGGLTYVLSDFINLGIDIDYFKTSLKKTRDSSYHETFATNAPGAPIEYLFHERKVITYEEKLLTLTPTITFKAFSRPKWFLYTKLGAVITISPNSKQNEVSDISVRRGRQGSLKDSVSSVVRIYDWTIKSPALGFTSALGVQIKVAGRLRAFGEVQFSHIVFIARKKSLIAFTVDNKSMLNTLPVSMRELEFTNVVTVYSTGTSPDKPSQALIQRIPITYLGAQLGLAFQL